MKTAVDLAVENFSKFPAGQTGHSSKGARLFSREKPVDDVLSGVKATAVTKRRSVATTQPRKRVPKKEKPLLEDTLLERPLQEAPLLENPLPESYHVDKPPKKPKERPPKTTAPKKEKTLAEKPPKKQKEKPSKVPSPKNEKILPEKLPKKPRKKLPNPTLVTRLTKPPKRKRVPEPQETTDSDGELVKGNINPEMQETTDSDQEIANHRRGHEPQETTDSDQELERSVSDEERQIALQAATKRLDDLLEETTVIADQLQKEEEEVRRLEEEKIRLLDQLLVYEGLAVDPYSPVKPPHLTKKPKRVRR